MPSTLRRILYLTWIIVALASAPHSALAEDPAAQKLVPSLIVMNAQGASLQGGTLTLNGVAPSTIVFADRPVRAAGHMLTAHVLEGWDTADEGFSKDPPNATVSGVLEGDLAGADGPASVFIDTADFEVSALQSMFPSTNWPPSMRH